MKELYGTGVALVTPFDAFGNLDLGALKALLAHTAQGVDYYVVMGTTGEAATVSRAEKLEVLNFVRNNNPKGLPIVYGIGGNNTREVVEELKHTDLKGVNAILSVSPYYSKPSQEGIYQHFVAVADASPLPIVLYNVPARTASNMTAETTLRLAAHKNIAGIKEASGNIEQCTRIMEGKPPAFILISGDDMMTVGLYTLGAVGVISVLANAYPVVFRSIKTHAQAAEFQKAATEQSRLVEINGPMYEEGNPVGVKFVLSQLGVCQPFCRLPHAPASKGLKEKIAAAMKKLS